MLQKIMNFVNPPLYGVTQEVLPTNFSTEDFMDRKHREDVVSTLAKLLDTQTKGTAFFAGMGGGIHDIIWSVFDKEKTEYRNGVAYPDELVEFLEGIRKNKLDSKEVAVLQAFEELLRNEHGITIERSGNKKKVTGVIENPLQPKD